MSNSDQILDLVLNNIPQGVFWKDRNSIYLGCNRIVARAMGMESPSDLIGKSDDQFPSLTRQQAESFMRMDRQVMETGLPMAPLVEPMNRFDGQTIWVETTKVPLYDSSGQIIGVLGTWQDVTERRRAEENLRQSELRHRSLVTAISEMVWTSNAIGGRLMVDPPLEVFTGMRHDQVRGAGWLHAVHPEDRPRAEVAWTTAVTSTSPYDCEFRLLRADGQWRHIHSRGIPIVDPSGRLQEWIGVGIDVTDSRLADLRIRKLNDDLEQRVRDRTAELEAANKELEAFSYSVSHDLRAPLRAIDGFSRILQSDYASGLPAEGQDFLRDIRTNTRMMGKLLDDLLSFSRLGRQAIKKQRFSSRSIVEQCLNELSTQNQNSVARLELADLPYCWGDPTLLKQVWLNLVSNAIKYSSRRDTPVIEIGATAATGSAERIFFVRDNGVGFDMRYAHKLFGVFQRLHRAEDYEGTGVGLAIVQRIVHRHGGRVWAESELNRGATFYFALPEQGVAQ